MTAVEWLQISLLNTLTHEQQMQVEGLFQQAKQIEKDNIAKAWDAGKHQYFSLGIPEIEFNNGKEYYDINYNITYKK